MPHIILVVAGTSVDQLFWSLIIGIAATSLATIIRFFGDDLGIVTAAYRAGAASRTEEVNRLTNELNALRTALAGSQRTAISSTKTSKLDMLKAQLRSRKSHDREWHSGRPIDRRTCNSQYKIGEVDFGRAYRLLKKPASATNKTSSPSTESPKLPNNFATFQPSLSTRSQQPPNTTRLAVKETMRSFTSPHTDMRYIQG